MSVKAGTGQNTPEHSWNTLGIPRNTSLRGWIPVTPLITNIRQKNS